MEWLLNIYHQYFSGDQKPVQLKTSTNESFPEELLSHSSQNPLLVDVMKLPNDLISHVVAFLEVTDLIPLCSVSKIWYYDLLGEEFWKDRTLARYIHFHCMVSSLDQVKQDYLTASMIWSSQKLQRIHYKEKDGNQQNEICMNDVMMSWKHVYYLGMSILNDNKCILVGDFNAGKTSFFSHALLRTPAKNLTLSCIPPSFRKECVPLSLQGKTNCFTQLSFWDTASTERFRSLAPIFWRQSSAVIFMYDMTNLDSFHSIMNHWYQEMKTHIHYPVTKILLGTKLDLVLNDSSVRNVPTDIATSFALSNGFHLFEEISTNDWECLSNLVKKIGMLVATRCLTCSCFNTKKNKK